ncbi:MAG: acetylglutamate kinase [Firmicutes bacterium]|nr:acetylglutamate kinase [Bacillota bacterium]
MFSGGPRCQISNEYYNLNNSMRLLWERQISWKRLAIISIVDKTKDVELVLRRLYKNSHDFANFLEPFYGAKSANTLGAHLKEHLVIAAELICTGNIGDLERVKVLKERWYQNALTISGFLNEINPYLNYEEFLGMFNEHLSLTEAAAYYRINQNFEKQVMMFDLLAIQAFDISDLLTNAIADQFLEFSLTLNTSTEEILLLN